MNSSPPSRWERWSDFTSRHPRKVLAGVFLLTLLLGAGLFRLDLATVLYDFRRPVARELVETIENNFKEGNYLNLIFESTTDKSIFSPDLLKEQLKLIQKIHEKYQIKTYSLVEAMDAGLKRVKKKSLSEVDDYTSIAEGIMGLSGGKTVMDLEKVSRHMLSHPEAIGYYTKLRIATRVMPMPSPSQMGGVGGHKPTFEIPTVKAVKALVQLDPIHSEAERKKIVVEMRDFVRKAAPPSLKVNLISDSLITSEIDERMLKNALWMTLIVTGVNSFIFFTLFRKRGEVVLPLVLMIVSLIWTFGFAGWFHIRISFVHLLVIPILFGTGDDDAFVFGMRLREESAVNPDLKAALRVTFAQTGTAIFLTTFTTLIAFLSGALPSASIAIWSFNLLVGFSMLAVFLVSIFLQGPLRLILAGRKKTEKESFLDDTGEKGEKDRWASRRIISPFVNGMNRFTDGLGRLSFEGVSRRPRAVLFGFLALFILGMVFSLRVPSEYDRKVFLRPFLQTYEANRQDEKYFGRSDPGYILFEGEVENPLLLLKIGDLIGRMAEIPGVEKILGRAHVDSPLDLLEKKGIDLTPSTSVRAAWNQVSESDATANFALDQTFRDAAEHLLHKTGDRYDGFVVKFFVEGGKGEEVRAAVAKIEKEIHNLKIDEWPGLRIRIGGGNVSYHLEEAFFFTNFTQSFFLSLIFNFLILLIFWRNFTSSLLAMVPIFLSLSFTMGLMGIFGISLNILNLTIGSIVVGVGVDYSIHMIERFDEEMKKANAIASEAMKTVLFNLGPGLWGGALTTVVGFGACTVLAMPLAVSFGLLMALAILVAYLASIFLLPVLLVRVK